MKTEKQLDKIIDFIKQDVTRATLTRNHEFVQYTAGRNGWSPWVSPKMKGYKMKCCDCGLVHEVDFKVVRFTGNEDKDGLSECKDVENKNIQVLWRLRRVNT